MTFSGCIWFPHFAYDLCLNWRLVALTWGDFRIVGGRYLRRIIFLLLLSCCFFCSSFNFRRRALAWSCLFRAAFPAISSENMLRCGDCKLDTPMMQWWWWLMTAVVMVSVIFWICVLSRCLNWWDFEDSNLTKKGEGRRGSLFELSVWAGTVKNFFSQSSLLSIRQASSIWKQCIGNFDYVKW